MKPIKDSNGKIIAYYSLDCRWGVSKTPNGYVTDIYSAELVEWRKKYILFGEKIPIPKVKLFTILIDIEFPLYSAEEIQKTLDEHFKLHHRIVFRTNQIKSEQLI